MIFPKKYTLKEIAEIIKAKYIGDADFPVSGMNEIHVVENGEIVFVDHPKYYDKALKSKASVILINKQVECPKGKALLISNDPFRDFNKLTEKFRPFEKSANLISDSAKIGKNTIVQHNVFIGNHVSIGKNCLIHSNVSIYDYTIIGDNVIIHAGTVIGADAFYYKNRPEKHEKLFSGGRVIIENDVELGALCSIDKGVSGDTILGEGTKIDNQVQIGHDTKIGKKCLIASQTGIAGCVVVEDEVSIWGQVGIRSDVRIAKGTEIFAKSGISKSTRENSKMMGSPAVEAKKYFRQMASIRKIPEMLKSIGKK